MGELNPVTLFDMADGFAPVTNVLAVADPDVHKFGDQWWMFVNGVDDTMRNNLFCAALPPGAPLASLGWSIATDPADPHRAVPLVARPDGDGWDGYGLHTPSYVRGLVPHAAGDPAQRERIYYAGRGSTIETGPGGAHTSSPYAIGVLEKTSGRWVRHLEPILTGTVDRPSVLEPQARYLEGRWRIWYVATNDDPSSDEFGRYQLEYVESADGITGWSTPRVLFTTGDGYFDAAVVAVDGGYDMVVSRHRTTPPAPGDPEQGLWWLTSTTASGDRSAWTADPVRILDTDHHRERHTCGAHGPCLRYGDTADDRDTLYVFFNRIDHPPQPPFSAPFFCSIDRIQLTQNQLRHLAANTHASHGPS